jgi:hypothetical protein
MVVATLIAPVLVPLLIAAGMYLLLHDQTAQASATKLWDSFTTGAGKTISAPAAQANKGFIEYALITAGVSFAGFMLYLHQSARGQLAPPPPPAPPQLPGFGQGPQPYSVTTTSIPSIAGLTPAETTTTGFGAIPQPAQRGGSRRR